MIKLELLAPAKNYEYAIAAINAGADAIYIGAPLYGARYGASNTIEDIAKVVEYAHSFGVRVYVTLNTLLFDNELDGAKKIANSLIDIGCDALIVQDMAFREMGLNIPIHASTQAAATTPPKVKFLEEAGFERVILERFLSLDDIKEIRNNTQIELEAFVHGAICVSESGRCYLGQAVSGRSGNRGVCSQLCRTSYTLKNEGGEVLLKDKHLLSLADLNLSHYIDDLAKAGITSFKIEGRLKDMTYLKNSVAYYREKIDSFIAKNSGYERASIGYSEVGFTPMPEKSFSRRFTSYFINGESKEPLASFATAKALGKYIGTIEEITKHSEVIVTSSDTFIGGDGVCFINPNNTFGGSNVNGSERCGKRVKIKLNTIDDIKIGAKLYRNYDKQFSDSVLADRTERFIDIRLEIDISDTKIEITAIDEENITISTTVDNHYESAKDGNRMVTTLKTQLSKSGGTIFKVKSVDINGNSVENMPFIPIGEINSIRRELLDRLLTQRLDSYSKVEARGINYPTPYCTTLDGTANITNHLAKEFYEKCGFVDICDGYDLSGVNDNTELMRCRYCLRKEINACLKKGAKSERLFIESNRDRFELIFDCNNCRMLLKRAKKG